MRVVRACRSRSGAAQRGGVYEHQRRAARQSHAARTTARATSRLARSALHAQVQTNCNTHFLLSKQKWQQC